MRQSVHVSPERRQIEEDLRATTREICDREEATGRRRHCSYGISGGSGEFLLNLPSGYEEIAARVRETYGADVHIHVEDWVRISDWADGSGSDAREAVRRFLDSRGIDVDGVPSDAIRIDVGSRRIGQPSAPYYRCWVREDVLTSG